MLLLTVYFWETSLRLHNVPKMHTVVYRPVGNSFKFIYFEVHALRTGKTTFLVFRGEEFYNLQN